MTNGNSFQTNDDWIASILLSILFVLAPLYPQNIYAEFAFFYRSSLFILMGFAAYRLGADALTARLRSSPLAAPACAWITLLLFGLLYTPDVYNAVGKLILIVGVFLLYALILSGFVSERVARVLLWSLAIGGSLAALHGLYVQWVGHAEAIQALKDTSAYPDDMRAEMIRSLEANRALGRFGNPNQLAGYLVLSLWPLWILWKREKNVLVRLFIAAMAILLMGGTYRTYSRSGLLILAFTLVFIVGYELFHRGFRISRKTILIVLGGCVGFAILAALMAPVGFLGGRLMTVSTIVARIHFFRGALLVISNHPWIGVGPEGFEQYYCAFLRPGDLEAHYVHNVLLESAVEGGLFGAAIFVWVVVAALKSLAKKWRNHSQSQIETVAALGALVSFLLLSLVDFHNNLMEMWLAPIVLLALAHRSHEVSKPFRRSHLIVGTVMAVLALTWIFGVACRYWNDNARTDGRFLALDNQKYEARQAYERAVLFDRTDAESWRQLSFFWAEIPNSASQNRRLECLEEAVYWAPRRASIRADYADALFALGYADKALEQILQAQRLFPARPVYYERAAVYYRFLKRNEEAEQQLQKANQIKKEIEAKRI